MVRDLLLYPRLYVSILYYGQQLLYLSEIDKKFETSLKGNYCVKQDIAIFALSRVIYVTIFCFHFDKISV